MKERKHPEHHPIKRLTADIEKYGVMVIEGVTSMPLPHEPHISPYLVIGVSHRGRLRLEYDMQPVEFLPHDISVVYPGHILIEQETSDDYLATLVVVSPDFLKALTESHPTFDLFDLHYHASFHLNDEQYDTILASLRTLRAISQLHDPERDQMLIDAMGVCAQLIRIYMQENGRDIHTELPALQHLLSRFHKAIAEHYRESREVQFYARLLCFSPKYFGSLVRQATGVSASAWIARYVIVQAKNLLRNRPDLTIQQIGSQLGFPDQAAFSRYFKDNAGISARAYREKHV